jgi:hypothetical protein
MKVRNYYLSSALLISSCLNIAYAKDYPVYAGIGTSFKNYEFSFNEGSGYKTYFKEALPSIKYTVGYIGANNKYSVSLFGDNIINGDLFTPVNPIVSEATTAKLKRDDYGINVSYNINSKISVLGGYRYGITSLKLKTAENNNNVRNEIKTYGPYVGARYLLLNKGNDRLFASLNYNLLSTEFNDGTYKYDYDASGYALSLGWNHQLGNNNSLYIAGEYHSFDHDDFKKTTNKEDFKEFSIKESVLSARIEFIHAF